MKFSEKANIWMGLQMAMVIVESQKDNQMQEMAIKALKSTLDLFDSDDDFFENKDKPRKIRKDYGIKKKPKDFLNALLEKKNITQKELAIAMGVRQQSVSDWQEKKRIPRLRFDDVCDFLSVNEQEKIDLLKMQHAGMNR